mmetsp:Transcript_19049/g.57551  ORF Transcript_19049/g.57551 Transcript_19049/m.57551 type:complete len:776 (+) Transcript_19049:336-2663(+)|eukprot:CAMPEP_0206136994 /NCGR_PEP_ID=MMETSP1473-20131121/2181_1 /ASSEMBLY_ACC=CAM_ASM_001109 /TAXON_ID=1461547 /ORGANISM="Stichococcus sp, Strain RCC1054" /LENGTH=775 /DNA_ID=CAMNT_0053529865 /DNA_START=257 /DNA_END=2584 /DNA_ORIENTATION=+
MSSRRIKEALQEPGMATSQDARGQIVAGIMSKWVNLGKGWRPRLFVLKGGVLRYYRIAGNHVGSYAAAPDEPEGVLDRMSEGVHKVLGPTPPKANLHHIFEVLRSEGPLQLIGAEAGVLEEKWRRSVNGQPTQADLEPLEDAQAEIHLQVADVEASQGDHCKLYIHTNINGITYRIKAETAEDRRAWMEALAGAKAKWGGRTPEVVGALGSTPSTKERTDQDAKLEALQASVRAGLRQRGATADVATYVEGVLREQHEEHRRSMANEGDLRRALQQYVAELEEQRRQLETQVVVESQTDRRPPQPSASARALDVGDAHSDDSGTTDAGNDKYYSDDEQFFECAQSLERPGGSGDSDSGALARLSTGGADSVRASSAVSTGEESDWIKKEGPPPQRRDRLPKPQQAEKSVSLWSILKEVVGKDLTRVCLPVYFNEPLSALQKLAEELEYSEVIDQAMTHPAGSLERLLYISAFAVSGYSGTAQRTSKPFNPLLGETYELVCQEKGVRMLAEKVVHHPTIIAGHCQGRGWSLDADSDVRSKFWGRSIELTPVGTVRLRTEDGEEYLWNKVTSTIGNLILGKIYIDHGGIMKVRNVTAGLTAKMNFKESGGLLRSREQHVVQGTIEKNGQRLAKPTISGKWDESLTAELENGGHLQLWQRNPPPPDPTRYNLTGWAIKLNELTDGLEGKLAPTDCRLRPDQRATELGNYDEANKQKLRLETKQRAARKAADAGETMKPRWFTPKDIPMGEGLAYEYAGGYWEQRARKEWTGCRDIFGD